MSEMPELNNKMVDITFVTLFNRSKQKNGRPKVLQKRGKTDSIEEDEDFILTKARYQV